MIEIEREKQTEMAECASKVLKYAGKLMQCIEEIGEDEPSGRMGERNYYGNGYERQNYGRGRGRMGNRMPNDNYDPYMY